MAIRSGDPPHPAQRLLSKKRAPEREERLVYVGALVIPHAQPPKLTEPGKCALHDPPPPAQATPMLGTADGQQGHNVASPETAPNGGRVVAAIPDHTVRSLPRSPPFIMQRGNCIHQRQRFLRVVPVRPAAWRSCLFTLPRRDDQVSGVLLHIVRPFSS